MTDTPPAEVVEAAQRLLTLNHSEPYNLLAEWVLAQQPTRPTIADRIAVAQIKSPCREQFSPSRWPYTYAYDFMRQHGEEFGVGASLISRSEAAGRLKAMCETTGEDYKAAVRELARAYCREHGIPVPDNPEPPDETGDEVVRFANGRWERKRNGEWSAVIEERRGSF